ncbi:hypothetical protein ACPEIC_40520 [Stenotrophomonas sp. NPDC087984]
MNDYLTPPPGWHYSVHPWYELDDIDDLPDLVQVGTILLPEFFYLAIGTEGMWSDRWPEDDDFALFLRFFVFEGRVTMSEARSSGCDLPEAFYRVDSITPSKHWKRIGIIYMTRYLTQFAEEGERPDEDMLPPHGPRAVTSYTTKPEAAMKWLEQLQSQVAEAYATAQDGSPTPRPKPKVRRKRNRITDEFLLEVAQVYLDAEREGLPPTREVATRFDAPHSTAAKWVGTARKRELLPPAEGKVKT